MAYLEAGETMAKVVFNELVHSVSGKLCKNEGSPIFAKRSDTGTAYVYHRHSKPAGEPTDAQKANQQRFSTAQTQTAAIMNDMEQLAEYQERYAKQSKYKTLRSFIFSEVYAGLSEK